MNNVPKIITKVDEIGRYGAAIFCVSAETFYNAGFASGDIVSVEIGGKTFVVPVCTAYTDVDNGQEALLKIEFEDRMLLAVSGENGFAQRNVIAPGDPAVISMKEKGAYLEEFQKRSIVMGTERSEYDSDEAFCNFRAVSAGMIRENYLYRGFSPINPQENRAEYTDRLLSQTAVKTVINLDGEGPEECAKYPGFEKSFYGTRKIIPLKMNFSTKDPGFPELLRKLADTLLTEEGPFYIHCRYGRDRTGLLCMILEALCEADLREVLEDYMLSFENIHGIERYSSKWQYQLRKKPLSILTELLGEIPQEDMSGEELRILMEKRLQEICEITEKKIRKLENRLCGIPAGKENTV